MSFTLISDVVVGDLGDPVTDGRFSGSTLGHSIFFAFSRAVTPKVL